MEIDGATLMHGHQFKWNVSWQPTFPPFQNHYFSSGIVTNQAFIISKKLPIRIRYGQPIALQDKQYGVNVGSVINHREWCLYDSKHRTVTFMCVPPIHL